MVVLTDDLCGVLPPCFPVTEQTGLDTAILRSFTRRAHGVVMAKRLNTFWRTWVDQTEPGVARSGN